MGTFAWQDKFSVNVAEMDKQHQRLLEYFSAVEAGISSGAPTQATGELLNTLIEYARFHFEEEERLMRAIQYADLESQLHAHNYFLNTLDEITAEFKAGTLPGRNVIATLRDWYINHITFEDKKYGKLIGEGNALI